MVAGGTERTRSANSLFGKSWLAKDCHQNEHIDLHSRAGVFAVLRMARYITESRSVDKMIRGSGEVVRTIAQVWYQVSNSL